MAYQEPRRHPPSAATSRASKSPEPLREEQEAEVEEIVTSQTNFSSSPDALADDFKLFQELAQQVAEALQIPLQEVTESHHKQWTFYILLPCPE